MTEPAAATQETGARFTGVVALDGPSGTGKSTVARTLARRLGAGYLDTGAMYRAITALVLRAGVDPTDSDAVAALADCAVIEISTDPDDLQIRADGHDVTVEIRSAAVTAAVSPVSAVPAVRRKLVAQQRQLIALGAIVVEGRDIASVVWPQAELKVYLTASEEVRAQRRAGQTGASDVGAIAKDLARRDSYDSSRADSPLIRADGAQELDTSELDIDGVLARLLVLAGT